MGKFLRRMHLAFNILHQLLIIMLIILYVRDVYFLVFNKLFLRVNLGNRATFDPMFIQLSDLEIQVCFMI